MMNMLNDYSLINLIQLEFVIEFTENLKTFQKNFICASLA